MAKRPSISNIASGFTSTTTLNSNFQSLQAGFDNVISLDGSTPNAMQADLDLNGNALLNVNEIYVNGTNILNILDNVTVSTASPSGGNDGDIWFKVSS